MGTDITVPLCTEKQQSYIAILCNDLGLSREKSQAHMSAIVGHPVVYLDTLNLNEASQIISTFKAWKLNPNGPTASRFK